VGDHPFAAIVSPDLRTTRMPRLLENDELRQCADRCARHNRREATTCAAARGHPVGN
jgi:hypothetical protein